MIDSFQQLRNESGHHNDLEPTGTKFIFILLYISDWENGRHKNILDDEVHLFPLPILPQRIQDTLEVILELISAI